MAKLKVKTHKATKKRFRVTPTGKVLHGKQGDNAHLRSKKTRNRKARLDGQSALTSKTQTLKVKKLLGA